MEINEWLLKWKKLDYKAKKKVEKSAVIKNKKEIIKVKDLMFVNSSCKYYQIMWKFRKSRNCSFIINKLICIGLFLQLIANIGEYYY